MGRPFSQSVSKLLSKRLFGSCQIKRIGYLLGWRRGEKAHYDDEYTRHDKSRQQLIDPPNASQGFNRNFQINTMVPPEIMPASAPHRLLRFQNSAKSITGPKAAPNPAQAKETIPKMELSGLAAMMTEIMAIRITVPLATHMAVLSLAFLQDDSAEEVL